MLGNVQKIQRDALNQAINTLSHKPLTMIDDLSTVESLAAIGKQLSMKKTSVFIDLHNIKLEQLRTKNIWTCIKSMVNDESRVVIINTGDHFLEVDDKAKSLLTWFDKVITLRSSEKFSDAIVHLHFEASNVKSLCCAAYHLSFNHDKRSLKNKVNVYQHA